MAGSEKKTFDSPDETRTFENGRVEVVNVISGRLHVVMDDGEELEAAAGDGYLIAPGHDAWVVGDEAWHALEFESKTAETYATS